ncbi:MAG TPA: phosphoribosylformylglycinamidine cyclo-ligase [Planctomycetota bacterium]|nr:phosphoribosylformylglycinamidine cyclo-ligase [Planctomycetota bacterium]
MVTPLDKPLTYKDAGVDIDHKTAAMKAVARLARATHGPSVLTGIGSFGSLFKADFGGLKEPVLVSSTDGVGTKLLVARRMKRFDTVGACLVNHCINDILVMGATPLFFLDYIAAGHYAPGMLEALVKGFADACQAEGVALVGGETAEMPGLYGRDDFDLAGFIVGVVDRAQILSPERVRAGDVLVGLHSSGLHTNGYSLAQKIFFEREGLSVDDRLPGVPGTIGEALLAVHRPYLRPLRGLLRDPALHAMAHITGGGFTDNIPRVLPPGVDAVVDRDAWAPPALFLEIARRGPVERAEMDRTFNMGIGMVLLVDAAAAGRLVDELAAHGERPVVMGRVEPGRGVVRYAGRETLPA